MALAWSKYARSLAKIRLHSKFSQLIVLGEYIPYTNANVLIGSQIGGWLMLGIVFAGITALGVTHFLGMKNMRRPRRRQLSRILWVEALTKSKLARFVWLNWHLAKGKNWKNFKAFRRGRDHKNVLMAIWSEEKTHHGSQQAKRSSVYIDFTFEHDSEIGITCLVYP